jgi:hypothetical protein
MLAWTLLLFGQLCHDVAQGARVLGVERVEGHTAPALGYPAQCAPDPEAASAEMDLGAQCGGLLKVGGLSSDAVSMSNQTALHTHQPPLFLSAAQEVDECVVCGFWPVWVLVMLCCHMLTIHKCHLGASISVQYNPTNAAAG